MRQTAQNVNYPEYHVYTESEKHYRQKGGRGGGVGALKQGSRDTSEPLSDLHTSLSQARAQCAADLEVSVEQI